MNLDHKHKIIATIIATCLLITTACSCSAHPTAEVIIDKTLSAITAVKSYQLDTDFTDGGSAEYKGTKLVNVPDQSMAMIMIVTMGTGRTQIRVSDEEYCKDGKQYLKTIAESNIPQTFGWNKTPVWKEGWDNETQISFLSEVLKNAAQVSSLADEKIDNTDCYVLSIIPAAQAAYDWVLSQSQSGGYAYDVDMSGHQPVVRSDTFHTGLVKLWIDRKNYLPLKIDADFNFQGDIGPDPSSELASPSPNIRTMGFHGQQIFSHYNQPVSIQVPPEALAAPETAAN